MGESPGFLSVPTGKIRRLEMRLPSTSLCRFLPPQTAPPLPSVVGGKAPGGRALGVIAVKAEPQAREEKQLEEGPSHPGSQ